MISNNVRIDFQFDFLKLILLDVDQRDFVSVFEIVQEQNIFFGNFIGYILQNYIFKKIVYNILILIFDKEKNFFYVV